MMTQYEFLERLWKEVIRDGADGEWIDAAIKTAAKGKAGGDRRLGELLKGLIDKGASKQEIIELLEVDRQESVFSIIHMIEEDGVEPEAWQGIHEAFDTADPGAQDEPDAKGSQAQSGPVLTLKKSHYVAFSPDQQRVVAAKGGQIWEIASGKELAVCELPPHTRQVAWSPNGKVIAILSTSGAIRLCDSKTGKKIKQVKMAWPGRFVDFSPDGKLLAGGDGKGNLFAWNATNGKLLNKREVGKFIDFVRTSSSEIAVIADGYAIEFDPTLKTERWRAKIGNLKGSCLHLAGETRRLFGWQRDQLVKLSLDKKPRKIAVVKVKVGEKGYSKAIAVSPDGRFVCAVHGDDFILLDDSLREIGRHSIEYANAATFSSDSSLIALASWNQGEIWRVDAFRRKLNKMK